MNHLILDTCVLSVDYSPVSDVLSNDSIKYDKVSFGLVQVFGQNLVVFWEKLSETVTEIDITRFETSSKDLNQFELLTHFTRLFTVFLDHKKFISSMKNLGNLRKIPEDIKYCSVKILHSFNFASEDLDLLLSFFPNITDLYIETSQEDPLTLDTIQCHVPILKRLILRASSREWIQIITVLESTPNLQLVALECKVEREQMLNLLLDYLPKQPNLSSIILHTNRNLNTVIPKLKILYIDFIQDLLSFRPFQVQGELEELHLRLSRSQHRFQHQNSECFFGHQIVPMMTLKKLFMEEFNDKSCIECYKNLFQGCLNLETLSIVQTTVGTSIFDLLLKHQKKLTELRIELARVGMIRSSIAYLT